MTADSMAPATVARLDSSDVAEFMGSAVVWVVVVDVPLAAAAASSFTAFAPSATSWEASETLVPEKNTIDAMLLQLPRTLD